MRKILSTTTRRIAVDIRDMKSELAAEIPSNIGFPFSAWFFIGVVGFTFLDAYLFEGRGLGDYLDIPGQMLAHASKLVSV